MPDRRQQKTRKAVFTAFRKLLEKKNYNAITVQEIIDEADIGRSTFYAHFETKDDLLKELCENLFSHILNTAFHNASSASSHGPEMHSLPSGPDSVFCHLLQHLEQNDNHILSLLSCDSNEIFLRYFKESLNDLIKKEFISSFPDKKRVFPEDFLIHHISCSFVEMVLWWIQGNRKYSPAELDQYFRAVIEPIL